MLSSCPEDCEIGARYKCALIGSSAGAVIEKLKAAKFALEPEEENDGTPFMSEFESCPGSGKGRVKWQSQERCDRVYVPIEAGLLASVELLPVKAFQDDLPSIGSMDECNTRVYLFVFDPRECLSEQAKNAKFRLAEMGAIVRRAGFKALHATALVHCPEEEAMAGRQDFAPLLTDIEKTSRHDDVYFEANFDDPGCLYAAFTKAMTSVHCVNQAQTPVALAQASSEFEGRSSCCTVS